uniref:Glutathione S-transferase sigma 8 n=1 Tax=Brachionus koreanus TaxID=1199090 RepID=A0A0A7DNL6_9BILA|nr:glutathione S-transferase sigma 8 [Brachionus koreanus]
MSETRFKLMYSEDRGKADLIKLILAYLNQSYEDFKIKPSEWNYYKSFMPFEQLPVLIIDDKVRIAQATTIARFLAKKFNLHGTSDIESALCDMVVEQIRECGDFASQIIQEVDSNKKRLLNQKYLSEILPKTLSEFEKMLNLNGNNCIVGSQLTWADLALANSLTWLDEFSFQLLRDYPLVKKHNQYILSMPRVNEWFRSQKPLSVYKKA